MSGSMFDCFLQFIFLDHLLSSFFWILRAGENDSVRASQLKLKVWGGQTAEVWILKSVLWGGRVGWGGGGGGLDMSSQQRSAYR